MLGYELVKVLRLLIISLFSGLSMIINFLTYIPSYVAFPKSQGSVLGPLFVIM